MKYKSLILDKWVEDASHLFTLGDGRVALEAYNKGVEIIIPLDGRYYRPRVTVLYTFNELKIGK